MEKSTLNGQIPLQTGQVGVIIERCGSHSTGQVMVKYLPRAENMQRNPLKVNRKRSPGHGCLVFHQVKKLSA